MTFSTTSPLFEMNLSTKVEMWYFGNERRFLLPRFGEYHSLIERCLVSISRRAAFYPLDSSEKHPLVPDSVDCLTMFADYRVPQMLQHLGTTIYSDNVIETLKGGKYLEYGSDMECSIRASSIVAVQQLREKMVWKQEQLHHTGSTEQTFPINSVLIDFLLWDLAKLVESGQHSTGRVSIPLPCHRTRSTYY
ncbi:hypothetical protein FRC20_008238 [Serendipita sp. 405]|nr:hypothetical protein FRC20_008238 [Serendipita sp. 405]